jgi:hypothetical protein
MAKYFILACDGGGIRGYITASVLEKLLGTGNFLPQVNLRAGTSTGSFIALALAAGKDISSVKALYQQASAKQLFTPNFEAKTHAHKHFAPVRELIWKVEGFVKGILEHIDDLVEATFTNEGVKAAAQGMLGETTKLRDLAPVVVNTLQLANTSVTPYAWTPTVISNFPGAPYGEMYAWEAGMCSGAAPIYFPPYLPTSAPLGYCADGGLFANNPSLAAVSVAIAQGIPLQDIYLLSFDTGTVADAMSASVIDGWGGPLHMGPVQWMWPETKTTTGSYTPKVPLLSAIMDSTSASIALNAQSILGANYMRVTVPLTTPVALDDYSDAAYATMDAAIAGYLASPGYAAAAAWIAKHVPVG